VQNIRRAITIDVTDHRTALGVAGHTLRPAGQHVTRSATTDIRVEYVEIGLGGGIGGDVLLHDVDFTLVADEDDLPSTVIVQVGNSRTTGDRSVARKVREAGRLALVVLVSEQIVIRELVLRTEDDLLGAITVEIKQRRSAGTPLLIPTGTEYKHTVGGRVAIAVHEFGAVRVPDPGPAVQSVDDDFRRSVAIDIADGGSRPVPAVTVLPE